MARSIPKYNATFKNLEYRLRRFSELLPLHLRDIIQDNKDVIISMIRDDQLYRRGVNGHDIKIMSYMPYAQSTIERKKKKGQPTTRVTLKDTGEFYDDMFVLMDSDGFIISSTDYEKTYELTGKYGDEIFRLTDKNLTRLIHSHIKPRLIAEFKKSLRK